MIASKCLASFTSDLEIERNTLQAFIEILKKEEQALIHGKIEALDNFASDKSRLIEKLIQLDDQRKEYTQNQESTVAKDSMNTWLLEQHTDQLEAQVLWNELLELAKAAQQLNHSNGLIISSQLKYNQRAFTTLQCAAGNVSLYGPKGQAYI